MDLLDQLSSLAAPENYNPKDRYHDFKRTFSTDEGKRVLREILSWGRMFKPSIQGAPIDPYLMAIREGERNLVLRLLATVYIEPPEPKTRQTHRRGHA
jgi:hypothetical protein